MFNMRVNLKYLLFLLGVVLFTFSCKQNGKKDETTQLVNQWIGKEVRFPENLTCNVLGRDTFPELCNEKFQKEYKVLLYVDSMGCFSCRLMLNEWKQLIEESDSLFQGKVGFLLFFQPRNMRDFTYLLKKDHFQYPVFIDSKGIVNQFNNFPKNPNFQCFLLDRQNIVLAIGDPVSNQRIWELYKLHISGGKQSETQMTTTIKADKTEHFYRTVRKGNKYQATFPITNIGNNPLIISRISTTCGCVKANWDNQPVKPGNTTTIHVEMTPDEPGYFIKTITVYCNTSDSPLRLTVSGTTIE